MVIFHEWKCLAYVQSVRRTDSRSFEDLTFIDAYTCDDEKKTSMRREMKQIDLCDTGMEEGPPLLRGF